LTDPSKLPGTGEVPKINVEELMAKLRREVASQMQSGPTTRRDIPASSPEFAYLAVLAKFPALSALKLGSRRYWHVEELLRHEDEQFVRSSSHAVLGRDPNAMESERYLAGLRTGELSKPGLLAILTLSEEGRRAGVRIDGLWLARAAERLARLPVIGRPFSKMAKWLDIFQIRREVSRIRIDQAVNRDAVLDLLEVNKWLHGCVRRLESENSAASARLLARELALVRYFSAGETLTPPEAGVPQSADRRMRLQKQAPADEDPVVSMYMKFEDKFRGSREEIKRRVSVYLEDVRAAGAGTASEPVIDLGCGRGEWLEVLKENGLKGIGVDLNRDSVNQCRSSGLDVICDDALMHLAQLPAASCGSLTAFHMVEHLPLRVLMQLLAQARRVVKPGGLLILETPNPANLIVGAHTFYNDPTHCNPIPAETLAFMVESSGFQAVRTRLLHPYPSDALLKEDSEIAARLNLLLYGPQDYAVLAS
jgi:SAM-dependent methyltransferase